MYLWYYEIFMKSVAFLLAGLGCFLGRAALGAELPQGRLIELHSCDVYAGPCIVSSQATLEGRYLLRAWDFTGGAYAGTSFAGLQVALLQSSPKNLAVPSAPPGQAVLYLPTTATVAQRQALTEWIETIQPGLSSLQTRVVPLRFTRTATGYDFSAGSFVSVSTGPLDTCESGSCGETLWYTPRSPHTQYTVAVDLGSSVAEPLLKLKWDDATSRNVFLARFGGAASGSDVFVSSADFCGPPVARGF